MAKTARMHWQWRGWRSPPPLLPARAADTVSASSQDGYSRLSFTFAPAGHVSATSTGSVLTLSFDRKITHRSASSWPTLMGAAVASVRADADGKTFRFALIQPLKLHLSAMGNRAVVDLAPQDFTGTMPDLPPPPPPPPKPVDAAALPELEAARRRLRQFHPPGVRLAQGCSVHGVSRRRQNDGAVSQAAGAARSVGDRALPAALGEERRLASGRQRSTVVEFETDSDSGFHDFKDGTHVVLDILAPKTDAAAYAPPGTAKPQVTKMPAPASASAQAARPSPTPPSSFSPRPKPADAKPAPTPKPPTRNRRRQAADAKPPTPKPPMPKPPMPRPPTPTPRRRAAPPPRRASTRSPTASVTRDGAVLNFKGASSVRSAVFVRGLTAWIVLENAPSSMPPR